MKTAATPAALVSWLKGRRHHGIVFVPTMGALHEGHASLIRRARRLAGADGTVVVSVFVNPTQFDRKDDFSRYPRTIAADRAVCHRAGGDLVFHPSASSMYGADSSVTITEKDLSQGLCGASRPGHFDGVCTVVAKLFHLVEPDIAVFGEKDWQQLAVVRRMVRDLKFPVRIVGCPTVREEDGLAMSSRNRRLTAEERAVAPRIYQALVAASMQAESGEHSVARLRRGLLGDLAAIPGAEVDYAEIVEEETLRPLGRLTPGVKGRALAAVRFGPVRLIDNLPIRLPA